MIDPIGYNFIAARDLTAFIASASRPMLAGTKCEPKAIPVDVRVRLVCHEPFVVPAKASPGAKPAAGTRPVGTLLDCYM